jgi:hypothetical protein
MVKLCLIIKLIHLIRIVFFILISNPALVFCQDTMHISFNESISLDLKKSRYSFRFLDNGMNQDLTETSINKYIFKNIGLVKIAVKSTNLESHKHTHDCTHTEFPEFIYVRVDSIKMKFDPTSIATSQPIIQNQATDGIDLYIDVEIENYFPSKVIMNYSTIQSAGIGSDIKAELDKEFQILSQGKHRLKYHLSGICTQPAYIQFDFLHHNNKIEPIPLPIPVAKN